MHDSGGWFAEGQFVDAVGEVVVLVIHEDSQVSMALGQRDGLTWKGGQRQVKSFSSVREVLSFDCITIL